MYQVEGTEFWYGGAGVRGVEGLKGDAVGDN